MTNGVSGNIQEGFNTRLEAERAYAFAYAIGGVQVVPRHGSTSAPAPMPPGVMQAFLDADDDFLGAEWHVVFKGRTPGIYPTW